MNYVPLSPRESWYVFVNVESSETKSLKKVFTLIGNVAVRTGWYVAVKS